jgi:hypothetical protein
LKILEKEIDEEFKHQESDSDEISQKSTSSADMAEEMIEILRRKYLELKVKNYDLRIANPEKDEKDFEIIYQTVIKGNEDADFNQLKSLERQFGKKACKQMLEMKEMYFNADEEDIILDE